jgi:hypothetical protein
MHTLVSEISSPTPPSPSLLAAQVEPLLLALRQPPVIAKMAARYLLLVGPTLPLMAVRETITHYLIAQQVAGPGLVVHIITVIVAPLYSYLLLFRCVQRPPSLLHCGAVQLSVKKVDEALVAETI